MELSRAHTAILKALLLVPLLTEHEMSTAVSQVTRRDTSEIMAEIGKTLLYLKECGLIWAGQLFNDSRQHMWAACITKAGREHMKNVANTKS